MHHLQGLLFGSCIVGVGLLIMLPYFALVELDPKLRLISFYNWGLPTYFRQKVAVSFFSHASLLTCRVKSFLYRIKAVKLANYIGISIRNLDLQTLHICDRIRQRWYHFDLDQILMHIDADIMVYSYLLSHVENNTMFCFCVTFSLLLFSLICVSKKLSKIQNYNLHYYNTIYKLAIICIMHFKWEKGT